VGEGAGARIADAVGKQSRTAADTPCLATAYRTAAQTRKTHLMPETPDYSVDPSLFRWTPAATAATATTTATTKTLVVFDFDRTLSAVHMFEELRTQKGQQELRRDAPAFYLRMFGGQERISALRGFLRALSERCAIRVLSFGMEAEIKAALSHLELLDLFDTICGAAAWDRWGLVCTGGGGAKQQMLTCFQRELGCPVLLFADDDLANFPTQTPRRLQGGPTSSTALCSNAG
jgi:hypothetical protein